MRDPLFTSKSAQILGAAADTPPLGHGRQRRQHARKGLWTRPQGAMVPPHNHHLRPHAAAAHAAQPSGAWTSIQQYCPSCCPTTLLRPAQLHTNAFTTTCHTTSLPAGIAHTKPYNFMLALFAQFSEAGGRQRPRKLADETPACLACRSRHAALPS